MTQQIVDTNLVPKGYQQITTATQIGLTVPAGAVFAYLQAQDGDIRWRDDGTDPDGTTGMVLFDNQPAFLYKGNLKTIVFEDDGSAVSKLNVSYLGYKGSG